MRGYCGKILDIDLSNGRVKTIRLEEEVLREYVGGRGLAAKILWDRLGERWDEIDPLGPENVLTVLTGPLTGYIPGGRICVSGKSPLTNGIIGSTAGGEFPIELKCSGFDGILITGKSEKPVYILISDEHVELRDASGIWGLDGKQTVRAITKEVRDLLSMREPRYGKWREPSILYIGPAGERLVRTSAVMQKWSHAAGYGGYGAVMGSKNLKAIAVKGTGPLPEVYDEESMRSLLKKIIEETVKTGTPSIWGTATGGYNVGYKTSSEPIRNWQEEWHDEKSVAADRFARRFWVKRYWSDFGCPVACLKIAAIKSGPLKGAITDNPDYELIAYCGTNLGIFDPEAIIYLSSVVDDLGLSGINAGNVMGFAAELYERGILTKEDLDGIEPKWGDVKAFEELAHLIVERRKIGDILAEGVYRAAIKISKMKGVDVLKYAVQFKGMEVGAHGIRSGLDYTGKWPMCYACSTQPGDHTSIASPKTGEDATLFDSLVCCMISYRAGRELLSKFYEAITGWKLDQELWNKKRGRRIVQIQRALLLLGGPDIRWDPLRDDDNPLRWYDPLPSGPKKGSAPNREECMRMRSEYYKVMGWDENGIPTSEELKSLGLEQVDKVLQKIRKE